MNILIYLKENRVIIDAEDGEIYFKTHLPQLQAKLYKTVEIPAHSKILVAADSTLSKNGTYVLNNTSYLGIKHGVYNGKGLVDIHDSQFHVFLSNLSNKPKIIQAKTCIGYLMPMEDYKILEDHSINRLWESDHEHNIIAKEPDIIDNLSKAPEVDLKTDNENRNLKTKKGLNSHDLLKILDLNQEYLTLTQIEQVKKLIEDYNDIFSSKCLGATDLVTHKIGVGLNYPVNQMPYRVSPKDRAVIDSEVQRMLAEKIIEPSKSPWASPVVVVTKKMEQ